MMNTPVNRVSEIAVRVEPARAWTLELLQSTSAALGRAGTWASETAQQFGSVVSALMGPAVVSVYAFALWSLAGNLGWTDTFVFPAGPLSNWIIWVGIAILVHMAASILSKHTRSES